MSCIIHYRGTQTHVVGLALLHISYVCTTRRLGHICIRGHISRNVTKNTVNLIMTVTITATMMPILIVPTQPS